jgi:hypothetical protein
VFLSFEFAGKSRLGLRNNFVFGFMFLKWFKGVLS